MIEETQKNVQQMRDQMKHNTAVAGIGQHHGNKHSFMHNQHQSSSSSRNNSSSAISYATTSHQKPQSILEQEEYQPVSHRSNRLSTINNNRVTTTKPTIELTQDTSNINDMLHTTTTIKPAGSI